MNSQPMPVNTDISFKDQNQIRARAAQHESSIHDFSGTSQSERQEGSVIKMPGSVHNIDVNGSALRGGH